MSGQPSIDRQPFKMEKKRKSKIMIRNSKSKIKMMKNTNSNFKELPPELIQLILSKLSFVNLPNCRLVCKAWNDLVLTCKFDPSISISNLFFLHIYPTGTNLHCVGLDPKHLGGISSVAKFSSTDILIINSCNGLLCCHSCDEVCILNPMTNEYFKPSIISNEDNGGRCYFYGLGFSPKTKHYKLARLISFVDDESQSSIMVEIFAFGTSPSSEWTRVGHGPFSIDEDGVYFNGGLYWVTNDTNMIIIRLDIEDEKLEQISFPQLRGIDAFAIGVFNGTLYLTFLDIFECEYHVWKMEQDSSWTKEFVVAIPENLHYPGHIDYIYERFGEDDVLSCRLLLMRTCEDGKILCLMAEFYLILYDPTTESIEILTDHKIMQIRKYLIFHQIDSFNFDSLPKILGMVEG